ncbi:MAG: SUMF1/EgtB/PvdO family nonheme iron enzyme [Methylococcales bacterium]
MKLCSIIRLVGVLVILWMVPVSYFPAQATTEDELKKLEQQAKEIEKDQAAAKVEARRKKEAAKKAAAEAKRKAEAQKKADAAEANRIAAEQKAEDGRRAAEADRIAAEQRAEDERRAAEEARAATEKAAASAIEFVDIPGGSFRMGCSPGDGECKSNESPAHTVSIQAFRLGKYEVTQAQWQAVKGSNPSYFSNCGGDCPVETVSFYDVQDFIARLNRNTGQHYRLPSEAEWEYACRAGKTQTYCGSDNVDAVAWYTGNSGYQAHPVGKKQKNDFGLYDLSGNVSEWTDDCSHSSYQGAPSDNATWTTGDCDHRVVRGGSWYGPPGYTRSSFRLRNQTVDRESDGGFRLVRDY